MSPVRVMGNRPAQWQGVAMDAGVMTLIVCVGLTVVGLLLVALLWRVTGPRAKVSLLGLTALPMGIYLSGLVPQAIGAYTTLEAWWRGLTFTVTQVAGLSLLGVGVLFLLVSRVLPGRSRRQRDAKATGTLPSGSSRPTTVYSSPSSEATATRVLPRDTTQP